MYITMMAFVTHALLPRITNQFPLGKSSLKPCNNGEFRDHEINTIETIDMSHREVSLRRGVRGGGDFNSSMPGCVCQKWKDMGPFLDVFLN